MSRFMPWNFKHGDAANDHQASEYNAWRSMRLRCHTPTNRAYKNYGGRGISVCERWRNSYDAFLKDVGRKPSAGHTLERIDNSGNYEPGNVRWATRSEQAQNRRTTHRITFQGQTKTLREWAEFVGLPWHLVYRRIITDKWPLERALGGLHDSREGR